MDFRTYRCAWCAHKNGPLERCGTCPKYVKITGRKNNRLTAEDFCSICINRDNSELEIYCERNRYFQRDPAPGEDFDCYKYCPE